MYGTENIPVIEAFSVNVDGVGDITNDILWINGTSADGSQFAGGGA